MGILQHLLTQGFSLVVLLDQFCLFLFAKTVKIKILPLICPVLIVVVYHLISHKLFSIFELFFGCCHCSVVCFNSFSRKFSVIGIVPFFFINFIFSYILPLRSELFPVVVNLLELKNLMGILQHLLTQSFSIIVLLEQFCFFLFAKTVKVKILPLICPIFIVVVHHLISHKLFSVFQLFFSCCHRFIIRFNSFSRIFIAIGIIKILILINFYFFCCHGFGFFNSCHNFGFFLITKFVKVIFIFHLLDVSICGHWSFFFDDLFQFVCYSLLGEGGGGSCHQEQGEQKLY